MTIFSRVSQYYPRRLPNQIFLAVLFLVVPVMLVVGTILTNTAKQALQRDIKLRLRQIVQHSTGEVSGSIQGKVDVLTAAAGIMGLLGGQPWRQETVVVELALRFPAMREVSLVDLEGKKIVSSLAGAGQPPPLKVIQCAISQRFCISDVRASLDHIPVMDIAVPVRYLGKVRQVLVVEYSLRGIWDVVDKIQLGAGGEVYLIDGTGMVIAHPDKRLVVRNEVLPFKNIRRGMNTPEGDCAITNADDGSSWLFAYAPITSLNWVLIGAQRTSDAFEPIEAMQRQGLLIFALLLSGLVLAAFIWSRRMSQPIRQLMEATKRLSRGDTDVELQVTRRDEMGKLKYAFNVMTRKLKQLRHMEKMSMVGRSAAAIAHEMKNSLTLVKTFTQLIPQRINDRAFVKESTETIMRELDSWDSMLRNLIDFAKNPAPLRISIVDINHLVGDTATMAGIKAQEIGILLTVQLGEAIPAIKADPEKLRQVLVNLMANAFDVCKKGDKIRILTRYCPSPTGGHIELSVHNSGPVIPSEDLRKVFEPFYSTKESGLGMGLAICQDIVHRHQGRLDVESAPVTGTTFTVRLPVYPGVIQKGKAYDFREDRRH